MVMLNKKIVLIFFETHTEMFMDGVIKCLGLASNIAV